MRTVLPLLALLACAAPGPAPEPAATPDAVETPMTDAVERAADLRDPGFRTAGVPELPFAVGDPLALVLPAADGGEPIALASMRGRKLLLHIFGSW